MKMIPKVLILQARISLYNIPVYNIIAKNVELTVAYTEKNESNVKLQFNIKELSYKKVGGFILINQGFYKLCSKFDVVIFMSDLHYLSYCSLPFINRKFKVIPWTIGIRASYTRLYDVNRKKDFIDFIYGKVLNKSDAILFYMKAPIEFWGNMINKSKVFIAHNTVDVDLNNIDKVQQKNSILFVGTLYKEKGIYELIDAYIGAKKRNNLGNFLFLDIIGNGEEFEKIKAIIKQNELMDSVFLHGSVFNELKLSEYFSNSILCISPAQAGLSVLKSMGYGVPYVTRENAITGGERLNIISGENGILYKSKEELITIIEDAFNNPYKYKKMGIKAKEHYDNNATIKHMAKGFIDAIDYVIKDKVRNKTNFN